MGTRSDVPTCMSLCESWDTVGLKVGMSCPSGFGTGRGVTGVGVRSRSGPTMTGTHKD